MGAPTFEYKPAADAGMGPGERFGSVRREPGVISSAARHCACAAVNTYLRVYHRLTITGREHVPVEPPFVLIGNHASHMDAMVLAAAIPPLLRHRVFPVAAGDVFFTTAPSAVLSSLFINALPLWRKKVGAHALDDLKARLIEEPCAYILFPEGARSRDGQMLKFKAGLGMLVAGTPVKVVPAYIEGAFDALRPETKVPKPVKVSVRIGEAMSFERTGSDREGWESVAKQAAEAVAGLSGSSKE